MPITIDKNGWINGDATIRKAHRPMIEHGPMTSVSGIIVHQTGSGNAASVLDSYNHPGASGAHFLIDKDGTTYQVASVHRKTWHVGRLKAKCLESYSCSAIEMKAIKSFDVSKINKLEMAKSVPARFPSNSDAIGIELVGLCVLDPRYIKPGMTSDQIQKLTDRYGVYEMVTPLQNVALRRLIERIQTALGMSARDKAEIYPHSEVSWKNRTEATIAQWPGKI